jgi:hypothetical protein
MKIAMMADLHRLEGRGQQFAQSIGQRSAAGQELVDQLAIIIPQV